MFVLGEAYQNNCYPVGTDGFVSCNLLVSACLVLLYQVGVRAQLTLRPLTVLPRATRGRVTACHCLGYVVPVVQGHAENLNQILMNAKHVRFFSHWARPRPLPPTPQCQAVNPMHPVFPAMYEHHKILGLDHRKNVGVTTVNRQHEQVHLQFANSSIKTRRFLSSVDM